MSTAEFVVIAIDPSIADELRRRGGPVYVADEYPGYPCRQCLCDAKIGEELILVSHDPFATESSYRSASPIFLHRVPCVAHRSSAELPTQLTGRQLSVRAFDEHEMMVDAAVIAGSDLLVTIERFLSDPASRQLHVHNATRGCWAARVERV